MSDTNKEERAILLGCRDRIMQMDAVSISEEIVRKDKRIAELEAQLENRGVNALPDPNRKTPAERIEELQAELAEYKRQHDLPTRIKEQR